uniref:Uncharacterized protein n=1 Tax=Strongyloides venezuelensis TaxID=75913 RepID=A0A0K0FGI2_STRVS
MIVTELNSERSKDSVIFVKNNSSYNMSICIGKRYRRSEAKNAFYCLSCRNVGSKMKPPKTLRTAKKVMIVKLFFKMNIWIYFMIKFGCTFSSTCSTIIHPQYTLKIFSGQNVTEIAGLAWNSRIRVTFCPVSLKNVGKNFLK